MNLPQHAVSGIKSLPFVCWELFNILYNAKYFFPYLNYLVKIVSKLESTLGKSREQVCCVLGSELKEQTLHSQNHDGFVIGTRQKKSSKISQNSGTLIQPPFSPQISSFLC